MTAHTGPDDEPTLTDVQREYPNWHCWRAVSGLLYARPADALTGDPAPVRGEDPLDLRDQIRRAISLQEGATYHADPTSPEEPGGLHGNAACALTP